MEEVEAYTTSSIVEVSNIHTEIALVERYMGRSAPLLLRS
jgi:hypothetical protein